MTYVYLASETYRFLCVQSHEDGVAVPASLGPQSKTNWLIHCGQQEQEADN